jgi:hypothetical protein
MRFHHRREGADGVHGRDEGERPARQVVGRAGAPEADVVLGQPGARQHLLEDRYQHLHAVGGGFVVAPARRLGEADEGDIIDFLPASKGGDSSPHGLGFLFH